MWLVPGLMRRSAGPDSSALTEVSGNTGGIGLSLWLWTQSRSVGMGSDLLDSWNAEFTRHRNVSVTAALHYFSCVAFRAGLQMCDSFWFPSLFWFSVCSVARIMYDIFSSVCVGVRRCVFCRLCSLKTLRCWAAGRTCGSSACSSMFWATPPSSSPDTFSSATSNESTILKQVCWSHFLVSFPVKSLFFPLMSTMIFFLLYFFSTTHSFLVMSTIFFIFCSLFVPTYLKNYNLLPVIFVTYVCHN